MSLPKRYHADRMEAEIQSYWAEQRVYDYDPGSERTRFSIDTPPPTVSGHLHLGHVYSYTHPDLIARYRRMRGEIVFYPMGYDDNGLPTERLVERQYGVRPDEVGRSAFIQKCLQVSDQVESDYQALWKRLGLSVDWRYSYRTIDEHSRRTCQRSFIELFKSGAAYRREAPAIWCPECGTAIAQAELNDLERQTEFVTLPFGLENGGILKIATTRPELLAACVSVFVHPDDKRYSHLAGQKATVPLFERQVPILADRQADPGKGTGAVMCCTFGDTTDVAWWYTYKLPLIEAVTPQGRLSPVAGEYAGLRLEEARNRIKADLQSGGQLLEREATSQSVRVHERCDTPVEYIQVKQWFIRILDRKGELLEAGERIRWHPEYMRARYRAWVEGLSWDWCISRQRYFGVPFPVWYCQACGETTLAEIEDLPVDPYEQRPHKPCTCGSERWVPESDVFDTWATSSMSPQIVGEWLAPQSGEAHPGLYDQVFPFSLRPQGHEIIRTWTFYTVVKSLYHFGRIPWSDVFISGLGIAGEGMAKISKSRGGGPMPPMEMIERYSADALRYWAASSGTGKDAIISEEKIRQGTRLVTKLWNVARFCERFFEDELPAAAESRLTPADRWIRASLDRLVRRSTQLLDSYDYAGAKNEIETFFWTDLADNYLEMAKQRLYDPQDETQGAARATLHSVLLTCLKLFAPFIPYVSEAIYLELFAGTDPHGSAPGKPASIHLSAWPEPQPEPPNEDDLLIGDALVGIATTARRFKSEHNMPLSTELHALQLGKFGGSHAEFARQRLLEARADLSSITRASRIDIYEQVGAPNEQFQDGERLSFQIAIQA